MRNTFKKTERLNSKLLIGRLFAKGRSFTIYPFRVTFLDYERNEGPPVQILISVSKKYFKSAVDRNYIKRLIRESYRKNKQVIWDSYSAKSSHQMLIGMVYIGKTIPTYSELERKLILILHRLMEKDESNNR